MEINLDKNRSKDGLRVRKMHSKKYSSLKASLLFGLIKKLDHFTDNESYLFLIQPYNFPNFKKNSSHLSPRGVNTCLMHSPFIFGL